LGEPIVEARGGKTRYAIPLFAAVIVVLRLAVIVVMNVLPRHGVSRALSEAIGNFFMYLGIIWGGTTLFSGPRRVSRARRLGASVVGALVGLVVWWAFDWLLSTAWVKHLLSGLSWDLILQ
jgi:hypothetical protein